MELQPDKIEQLHQALSRTFNHGELKRLSTFAFGKNLEEITTNLNRSDVAMDLIEWAMAKDFLQELIENAQKINPRNTILQELLKQIPKSLQLQAEQIASLHQESETQMLTEAQSPIEKPVESQSETLDITTKKHRRSHMGRPQKRKRAQPMLSLPLEVDLLSKSPSTVLTSALVYYQEIKQKQIQLLPVYLLFSVDTIEEIPPEQCESVTTSPLFGIEDIWPEHCNFAVPLLQEVAQPVQKFYDLVNNALTRERTTEVVQLQFSLMIPLRMSYGILKNLISLIYEFKEVCQTSPDDMLEQRREIIDNLKELREMLKQVNTTMDAYSQ